MEKSSQKLGIWWDTKRGVWSANTPGAVEEPLETVDLDELKSEVEEWLGAPIDENRDALNEWKRFIDDVSDSRSEKSITHETLKRIVDSYIEREKEAGHRDARILRVNHKAIYVHAGPRDDWNPCGYEYTIYPKTVQDDLDYKRGPFYDAALEVGIVD